MNIRVRVSAFALAIVSLLALAATPAAAQLLKTVKDRGTLNCGVSEGLYGFSARDKTAPGAASTSTSAARSRRQFSTMRARSTTSRSTLPGGSKHSSRAASTSCRASPPGQCRARSTSASSSQRRTILMARGSSCAETLKQGHCSRAQRSENLCAERDKTELNLADYFAANNMRYETGRFDHLPRMRSKVMIPGNASPSRQMCRSFLPSGYCSQNPTITSFCRTSSPRSRLVPSCARMMCSGSMSSNGCNSPWSMPRNSA